jgi:TatD DNase family protein
MALIDTHTHLETFARRGALPGVLARAREAGLEAMVTIGTEPEDWELYRRLSAEHGPLIRHAVGLHPCSVGERWSEAVSQLEGHFDRAPQPVALGETGLDRFHLPKDEDEAGKIFRWQKASFAAHLELAGRLGCPLVVHSRGAFRESVEMIDASGIDWRKVVFHCFSEGAAEMAELRRRGGLGSFTGILTYKSAESVREAALLQGIDLFMLETDAPYLAPVPQRGKENEPAFLRHTAEYAAGLFGVSFEELSERSTANARRFYGL